MRARPVIGLGIAAVVATITSVALLFPATLAPWPPARDLPSPTAGNAAPPVPGTPSVRIAVAGDTGTGTPTEQATADRMLMEGQEDPYDALLLLGDLIYEDGDAAKVTSRVTDPFAPLISNGAELLPVLGNHDYRSNEQQQILSALGRQTPWYVEQIGPVRVVVLDSNRVEDESQLQWLRDTLTEPVPSGTWTIVAMHHPAYSAGSHGSDMAVRKAWGPMFAESGVPLVLAGHDHDYQRSTPQDGVTYVVSGAGAKVRTTGRQDFTAVSSSTLHYLDLLIYDDRLIGRAIDQSGTLVDTFTITR